MRWCAYCNTQFGEQEYEVNIDGKPVHERCVASYNKHLADRASNHKLLHLPSIHDKAADER